LDVSVVSVDVAVPALRDWRLWAEAVAEAVAEESRDMA
jgi:hypothetical protein